ncbi:MAG: DUF3536 domain-containing protein [Chitinivibrionales bacterium]
MTGHNKNYCIIHGHFYQPPRENPWLDLIEPQPSASPAENWNERIYDECYRANGFSRVLGEDRRIVEIYNNYRNLSFNFGPTLFRWMEKKHPEMCDRIIEADKESAKVFQGHGNAIAQAFNHTILPHATLRDKVTQIEWGVSFFESRFRRFPEGIWLPETAINMETVNCLIDQGIKFTVLSPNQAESVIKPEEKDPIDVSGGNIDTAMPYRVFPDRDKAPERYIDVFFFDEGLSKAISFEHLLEDSLKFSKSIKGASGDQNRLVTIATDGETFGHHKAFGDMCLSYLFTAIAEKQGIQPVNFGWYLENFPPDYEVKLKNSDSEGSSWSCAHGTGRWIRDCGCSTGGKHGWNQKWRTPLREAFNRLQERIDQRYTDKCELAGITDPCEFRNKSCTPFNSDLESYIKENAPDISKKEDIDTFINLLHAQKFMQYAFTSCAWFFADISGIETVQNIKYAARALQLGLNSRERDDAEQELIEKLDEAESNIDRITGKTIYQDHVKPELFHIERLAFTAAALNFIFEDYRQNLLNKTSFSATVTELSEEDQTFKVTIDNAVTKEGGDFRVDLKRSGGMKLTGVIENTETRETTRFDLSDIHSVFSPAFINAFTRDVAQETVEEGSSWINNHQDILTILQQLKGEVPGYLKSFIEFVINIEWDNAVKKLDNKNTQDEAYERMSSVADMAYKCGVSLDMRETEPRVHKLFDQATSNLEQDFSLIAYGKVRFLLNIIEKFNIPFKKKVFEERIYRILTTDFDRKFSETKDPDPETLKFFINFLNLARRMNFNTDKYPLP